MVWWEKTQALPLSLSSIQGLVLGEAPLTGGAITFPSPLWEPNVEIVELSSLAGGTFIDHLSYTWMLVRLSRWDSRAVLEDTKADKHTKPNISEFLKRVKPSINERMMKQSQLNAADGSLSRCDVSGRQLDTMNHRF